MYSAIKAKAATSLPAYPSSYEFPKAVREILRNHRISYDFEDGQIVPFASKELYSEVVEPALSLLRDSKYDKAEQAYRDGLNELAKGKPGDAIADAATALQEMLVALGCHGDSLGPLLKSARTKGLLAAHDPLLTEALDRAVTWVNADRSNTGDAHKADSAALDDAWLMVIVGATMLRLAGVPRSAVRLRT